MEWKNCEFDLDLMCLSPHFVQERINCHTRVNVIIRENTVMLMNLSSFLISKNAELQLLKAVRIRIRPQMKESTSTVAQRQHFFLKE